MENYWNKGNGPIVDKQPLKIGVVGFSGGKFNEVIALVHLKRAFDAIYNSHSDYAEFIVVSGYTAMGIPLLAYEEARSRGWKTKGIACSKAKENEVFPCDEVIIFGEEWGDESSIFLNDIDILVRVGGGKQSMEETAQAYEKQIPVIEFDLKKLK